MKRKRFRLTKRKALTLNPGTWIVVKWHEVPIGLFQGVALLLKRRQRDVGPVDFVIWDPASEEVYHIDHTDIRDVLGKVIVPSILEHFVKSPVPGKSPDAVEHHVAGQVPG